MLRQVQVEDAEEVESEDAKRVENGAEDVDPGFGHAVEQLF